jgi:hypothetical protein
MNGVMIVDVAVHALLSGIREALTIWLALVALAALACVLVSAPARRDRRRRVRVEAPRVEKPVRREWTVVNEPREDLRRYAEEVSVAANRAADAAERWRSEWLAVQSAKDAAWRAYETADEAARRAFKAAAFPTPDEPLTPSELIARERYLHRAAREAYQRGELSLSQLNDATFNRNGWNPKLHPFEQQVVLRRIGLERKLQAYRTVSAMEVRAWETAEVAEAAKHSLRREAYSAQLRAHQASRSMAKAPATQLYVPSSRARRPQLVTSP